MHNQDLMLVTHADLNYIKQSNLPPPPPPPHSLIEDEIDCMTRDLG